MPEIAQLVARVTADTADAEAGFARVGDGITGFAKGATIALAAAGAGIVAAGGYAVKAASDFETTMSGVKAVSGATAAEMANLSGLALQLGKDTSFSASQAASGIEELVKGGLSIDDIMNGAAKATLNLAAAGGISLPQAATIAANALAEFSLKGADMAHVSDLIAGAANASALDVGQFSYSLQAAGAVAATIGFKFDDLAQAIAVMGKAGVTGSDAGTSLKTMMLNLQPASKAAAAEMTKLGLITADGANKFFDAQGHVKSMAEVAGILQSATSKLTDAQKIQALQTIFGTDAVRAAAIMAKAGASGFNDMAKAMGKVTAESVAAERLNNLAGDMEQLTGSIETLAISFGRSLLPALRGIAQWATAAVNSLIPLANAYGPMLADALTKIGAAVSGLVRTGDLGAFAASMRAAFRIDLTPLVKAIRAVQHAYAAVVAGFKSGGIAGALRAVLSEAQAFGVLLVAQVETWGQALVGWIAPRVPMLLSALASAIGAAWSWLTTTGLPALEAALASLAAAFVGWISPLVGPILSALGQAIGAAWTWLTTTALPALVAVLGAFATALVSWISPLVGPILSALGSAIGAAWTWLTTTALPALVSALGYLASAFVTWIGPLVGPMLTALGSAIGAVWTWLTTTALPALWSALGAFASAFVTWIGPLVGPMLDALGSAIGAVWSWLTSTALPTLWTALVGFATAFVSWIAPLIGPMLEALGTLIGQAWAWLTTTGLPALVSALGSFAAALWGWIGPAIPGLLTALGTFLGNVWSWISDNAPTFLTNLLAWGKQLAQWVIDAVPGLLKALGNLLAGIWKWISDNAPTFLTNLLAWGRQLAQWVVDAWPAVSSALATFIGGVWKWISDNAPIMLTNLLAWGGQLVQWLVDAWPEVSKQLGTFIAGVWSWISDNAPTFLTNLLQWGGKLVQWLVDAWPEVSKQLGVFVGGIWTWISDNAPTLLANLVAWGTQLWQWIVDAWPDVVKQLGVYKDAVVAWVNETGLPAIKTAWGALGPALTAVFTGARDALKPVLKELGGDLDDLAPSGQRMERLFNTIGTAIDSVTKAFGKMWGSGQAGQGPSFWKVLADEINAFTEKWETLIDDFARDANTINDFYQKTKPFWDALSLVMSGTAGKPLSGAIADAIKGAAGSSGAAPGTGGGGGGGTAAPKGPNPRPGETVAGGPNADGKYLYTSDGGRHAEWRDQGGPGAAGRSYLIGTGAQPELFTPSTAGMFTPAGAAGPVTIPIYIGSEHVQTVVAQANRRWSMRGG